MNFKQVDMLVILQQLPNRMDQNIRSSNKAESSPRIFDQEHIYPIIYLEFSLLIKRICIFDLYFKILYYFSFLVYPINCRQLNCITNICREIDYLVLSKQRKMEKNFKRLSVCGHDNELRNASIQCLGG